MPQLTLLRAEQEAAFPPTSQALDDPDGLLAIGGQLTVDWLLCAYRQGIFPWFSEGDPIMWWAPAPRMVLSPGKAHIGRTLRKHFKKQKLSITANSAFKEVIDYCSDESLREEGTWITEDMKAAYCELHRLGWAHSIEVYQEDQLVGGLYGIGIAPLFYGESMFSLVSNASKYAFITLSQWAESAGLQLIDCQLYNPYLESLGADLISREVFEALLPKSESRLSLSVAQDLTGYLEAAMNKGQDEQL